MIHASAWAPWMSDALQAADVTLAWAAVGDSGADLALRLPLAHGPVTARYNVKKWDTVKPSTVDRLPRPYRDDIALLVVAERMSEEAVGRLRHGKYSWLSLRPMSSGLRGELRTADTVYAVKDPQRRGEVPPTAGRGRPSRAAGRLAQALFYLGEATQKDLVDETGVSQARISQLLKAWPQDAGVARAPGRPVRWHVDEPDRLVSAWLTLYVPEQRITSYWYGLESPREQARAALVALDDRGLVSGGLAADVLAPWALPQKILIYTDEVHDLSAAGFVPSPQEAATLELVTTRDPTIIPSRRAASFLAAATKAATLPLADPLVVLADLTRSDDLDADQAAQRLQARLVDIWRGFRHRV